MEYNVSWNRRRRFGLEYEFLGDANERTRLARAVQRVPGQTTQIAGYRHSHDNTYWDVKTDSSCGLEVSTPVMSGPRDLKTACDVLTSIQNAGFNISARCGQHVHVEVADFTTDQLYTLVCYWMKIEHAVMSATPGHRRGNTFCAELNGKRHNFVAGQEYDPATVVSRVCNARHDILNIQNFSRYHTVEFRFGDMTYDVEVVKNRVRFLIWFVDLVKNMPPPPDLNWFTPKQVLRFFGLLDVQSGVIVKHFSPAVLSMRQWLLENLQRNMPHGPGYCRDNDQVRQLLEEARRAVATASDPENS